MDDSALPPWQATLRSERDGLASQEIAELARGWCTCAQALHSERFNLSPHLDQFFFSSHGVIFRDGGSAIVKVLTTDEPRAMPVNGGSTGGQHLGRAKVLVASSRDANGEFELDAIEGAAESKRSLLALRLGCKDRRVSMSISLPWQVTLPNYVEQLIRQAGASCEQGYGTHFLQAIAWLWPRTLKVVAPLGRADLTRIGPCVRFRAALDYKVLTQEYDSVAEYLRRLRSAKVSVMDLSRTRLLFKGEIIDDMLQATLGVRDGEWVYLDHAPAGSWIGSTEAVPDIFAGSGGHLSVCVSDVKAAVRELGCMGIDLPTFWLELEYGPTKSDAPDGEDGFAWRCRMTDVGSPGRIMEAIMRPFFNLAAYRKELYEKMSVSVAWGGGRPDVDIRALVPVPSVSKALLQFCRWWVMRQVSQVDELRFVGDLFGAISADLANDVGAVPDADDYLSVTDSFFSGMSNADWFTLYERQTSENRNAKCCLFRWFRWVSDTLFCPRRQHFVSGFEVFHSFETLVDEA